MKIIGIKEVFKELKGILAFLNPWICGFVHHWVWIRLLSCFEQIHSYGFLNVV
jgi:hypothetical protein